MWRTVAAAARTLSILMIAAAGCSGEAVPAASIGGVSVPEDLLTRLSDPDRQTLIDLISFGAAVARDDLEMLGAPIIDRAVADARLAALPYALAFERLGYDESLLRAAYRDRPEWELHVRHVVRLVEANAPRARRDSARAVAEGVAARARRGDDFAALAAEFSEEPGAAERGGLLQPGRRDSWVEPFWLAALALQPGQTSGVVESPYGFHVLRLDDRRPVPLDEADRGALLRWMIRPDQAVEAMDAWEVDAGEVVVDPTAAAAVRAAILAGDELPGDAIVATGTGGVNYRGRDAAAGWALLDPADRIGTEQSERAFLDWLSADAVNLVWSRHAERLGVGAPPEASRTAANDWLSRALHWAEVFGFAPGMPDETIVTNAMQAHLSGAPLVRTARTELRSLRPLLREIYPALEPAS